MIQVNYILCRGISPRQLQGSWPVALFTVDVPSHNNTSPTTCVGGSKSPAAI